MSEIKKMMVDGIARMLKNIGGNPARVIGTRTNVVSLKTPPLLTDIIVKKGTPIDENFVKQAEDAFAALVGNKNASDEQIETLYDNLEFAQNMKNSPVYVANQEMDNLMKDAYYQLESAKSAVMNDKLDDARGILRYEVGENYKYPRPVREAAEDARYMIKRGEGIDWREQGYESMDEAKEDLLNKIQEAQNKTSKDYWPDVTDPFEGQPKEIQYYDFYTDLPEDTRNPAADFTDIKNLFGEFAKGGIVNARKNFWSGGSGDTGPGGGPSDTGSGHTGDSTSNDSDTGDLGSEEANNQALGAAMASIGGIGSYGDPTQGYYGSRFGNFARNVQNAMFANPRTSLAANSILGPIGSLLYGTAKAYGKTAEPGTQPTNETEGDGNSQTMSSIVQNAMADPIGISNAANAQIVDDYYDVYSSLLRPQAANGGIMTIREEKGMGGLLRKFIDSPQFQEVFSQIPQENRQDMARAVPMFNSLFSKSGVAYPISPVNNSPLNNIQSMFANYFGRLNPDMSEQEVENIAREKAANGGIMTTREAFKSKGMSMQAMIDWLVDKSKTKFSRQLLDRVAKQDNGPQLITDLFAQEIQKTKGVTTTVGKAPKTDVKKVRAKAEADKRITQELADEGQIEINEETASDMAEFMKKNDPEGYAAITKIVDDINKKNAPEPDDDPGMFDNLFDKMQKQMQDYIPGEEPLTPEVKKVPRKDNAKGGLNYLMGF